MKKLMILLIVLISFASCQKDQDSATTQLELKKKPANAGNGNGNSSSLALKLINGTDTTLLTSYQSIPMHVGDTVYLQASPAVPVTWFNSNSVAGDVKCSAWFETPYSFTGPNGFIVAKSAAWPDNWGFATIQKQSFPFNISFTVVFNITP